jgi:hypothetical protein
VSLGDNRQSGNRYGESSFSGLVHWSVPFTANFDLPARARLLRHAKSLLIHAIRAVRLPVGKRNCESSVAEKADLLGHPASRGAPAGAGTGAPHNRIQQTTGKLDEAPGLVQRTPSNPIILCVAVATMCKINPPASPPPTGGGARLVRRSKRRGWCLRRRDRHAARGQA